MPESSSPSGSVYLTTTQAGKLLEVNARTVTRWVDSGKLRAVILPSGHRRILREDIDRIVAAGRAA